MRMLRLNGRWLKALATYDGNGRLNAWNYHKFIYGFSFKRPVHIGTTTNY